jgi:hypothetical protein
VDLELGVARHWLCSIANLAHLDEFQAQRLDLLEDSVQRRLIGDRATEDRLNGLYLGIEALEAR